MSSENVIKCAAKIHYAFRPLDRETKTYFAEKRAKWDCLNEVSPYFSVYESAWSQESLLKKQMWIYVS